MASTMIDTPKEGTTNKTDRVLKERERRTRERTAYNQLRNTLELAEPNTFWRMEKVDIAEGAASYILRIAGGSTENSTDRTSAVETSPNQDEKLTRVEVEKRRRERESRAIKRLKEILMKYSKDASAKMEKLEVLTSAAAYIKTLAKVRHHKRASTPNTDTDGTSSPGSSTYASPVSSTGSVEPPSISANPYLTPAQLILASMMQPVPFLPMSLPLAFQSPSLGFNFVRVDEPAVKKSRIELWRPWE